MFIPIGDSGYVLTEPKDTHLFTIFQKLPTLNNNVDLRYQQDLDDDLRDIMKYLQGTETKNKVLKNHLDHFGKMYVIRDGVLKYYNGDTEVFVIPKQIRAALLYQYHDGILGGHLSTRKTLSRIKRKYYWPKMKKEVKEWSKDCKTCLTRKN